VLVGGVVALWSRRRRKNIDLPERGDSLERPAVTEPSVSVPVPPAPVIEPPAVVAPKPAQSPYRALLGVGGMLMVGGLLIVLQSLSPELSITVFILLLVACAIAVVFTAPAAIENGLRRIVATVRNPLLLLHRYARVSSPLLALAGIVLLWHSSGLLWEARLYTPLITTALLLLAAGLGAVALAVVLAPERPGLPQVTQAAPARSRMNLYFALPGALLLLFVAEVNGNWLRSAWLNDVTTHVQFILLVLGALLLALGLGGYWTGGRIPALKPHPFMTNPLARRWHLLALILIITLAFALRLYELDTRIRFLIDEDAYITANFQIRSHNNLELLSPFSSVAAFPYILPYFQSLTIDALGRNLVGMRAASAILGALGVLALYFLTRRLFDVPTALLAALLLATFPPHLQFSRIGINEMGGPLAATASLAFLARGLVQNRRLDYAAAGVLMGFTHYFDEGSRLLYGPLLLMWLVGALFLSPVRQHLSSVVTNMRTFFNRWWKRVLLVGVSLLLIAAPVYYTLLGIERPFFARMVDNRSGLPGEYWQNVILTNSWSEHFYTHILPAFAVYFNRTDATLFYGGDTAMLLLGVLPFFFLGIGYSLGRWRSPGPLLLLLWIFCVSMGNSLLVSSFSYPRFVIVFPALMLALAVGLRYGLTLFIRRKNLALLLAAGLGLFIAAYQTHFYFNEHLPLFVRGFREHDSAPDGYDAAWRSLDFPPQTQIHMISDPVFNRIEANGLLTAHRIDLSVETRSPKQMNELYFIRMTCDADHAFFILPGDKRTLQRIRQYFNVIGPFDSPYEDVPLHEQLWLYYAPLKANMRSPFGQSCDLAPD